MKMECFSGPKGAPCPALPEFRCVSDVRLFLGSRIRTEQAAFAPDWPERWSGFVILLLCWCVRAVFHLPVWHLKPEKQGGRVLFLTRGCALCSAGAAGDGPDHAGVLARQRRGAAHRAARQEDHLAALRPGGLQSLTGLPAAGEGKEFCCSSADM